jgi:hypothetical protein
VTLQIASSHLLATSGRAMRYNLYCTKFRKGFPLLTLTQYFFKPTPI